MFRSVRAMGMGNAFAAIANDGDAFYYNPAGLTAVRRLRVDLQPVRFIPTRDLYTELECLEQMMEDIDAMSESEDPLGDPDLTDERRRLTEKMERLLDENLGLDVAIPARIVVPLHIGDYGLAVGCFSHAWWESRVEVQRRGLDWSDCVKDVLDDEIIYDGMIEASYGAGVAVEMPVSSLPLEISLGLSARRIRRWRLTDEDDPLDIETLINPYGKDGIEGTADDFTARYFDPDDPWASVSRGKGHSIDIGAIGSLRDAINLAIVVQNLMGRIEYEDAFHEELSRNVGVSAAVNVTSLLSTGFPTMDVVLAASMDKVDKPRLGIEAVWDLPLLELSGRIGSNQGFLTLGAGIHFMFLDFDYAFYGDQDTDWHAFSLNLTF